VPFHEAEVPSLEVLPKFPRARLTRK